MNKGSSVAEMILFTVLVPKVRRQIVYKELAVATCLHTFTVSNSAAGGLQPMQPRHTIENEFQDKWHVDAAPDKQT
ncbi:MAG: hypothetical protein KDB29_12305, partial [Planctomycetes bacterium]|nr:hypothetical protein [Planctomycetota bacterium]